MTTLMNYLRLMAATVILGFSASVLSADIDVSADNNDLAIKGYDPVAYFTDGKAVQGDKAFTAVHKNAIYQFSNAANRDAFKADPEKYAPQYGGYCAFGVAMGKKFETDPNAWKVVDNKLYLNLDASVQKRWLEDVPGYIETADTNWVNIKSVAADKL
ncbi:hypothetical protein C9I98_16525 [Photobacterium sanctipauli]|uniref:YHS domain-containing protein n=1 Tax=Photobacterium sanctipauli TaxID=1342794 RepID=A0A2T3NQ24_9GAMM|nr:YHS domain-containing (seleno)protein [Photobacterium sanctipauli]PSW18307.1 hypothetical protein C9I98_16525 [Photobacterium sanctipauli]